MSAIPLSQILNGQTADSSHQNQPVPLSQVMDQQPANPLTSSPLLQDIMRNVQAATAQAKIAQLAQPTSQAVNAMLPGSDLLTATPAQQSVLLQQLRGSQNQRTAQTAALENAQQQAQENNQQIIAQHPVAGRFANFTNAASNALGQGVAAVQGLVNPQAAHATQQGLNITTPVVEG